MPRAPQGGGLLIDRGEEVPRELRELFTVLYNNEEREKLINELRGRGVIVIRTIQLTHGDNPYDPFYGSVLLEDSDHWLGELEVFEPSNVRVFYVFDNTGNDYHYLIIYPRAPLLPYLRREGTRQGTA